MIRVGSARLKRNFRTYLFSSAKQCCMKINHNGNRIDTTMGDHSFTPPQIRLRNTIIAA